MGSGRGLEDAEEESCSVGEEGLSRGLVLIGRAIGLAVEEDVGGLDERNIKNEWAAYKQGPLLFFILFFLFFVLVINE